VFQISQNIAHPGRTENGTPGPMSALPRQFNQRSDRRVVEYVRGVKNVHARRLHRGPTPKQSTVRGRIKSCKRWRTEQTGQTFPKGSGAAELRVPCYSIAPHTYHNATLARSSFSAACTTGLGLPTVTRTHWYHYCIIRTHHSCALPATSYYTQYITCRLRSPLDLESP